MFIEPNLSSGRRGWIEVICGSMFSGKTEELIRRLRRVKIANQRVKIFKPAIDTRYDEQNIVSHDEKDIFSTPVLNAETILLMATDVEVVGIDETQFVDNHLPVVCEQLAMQGIRVIIAKVDYITKLHAICVKCGNIASYSFRKAAVSDQFLIGETDNYEPRRRSCYHEKD